MTKRKAGRLPLIKRDMTSEMIRAKTIDKMKSLGTYKPEFEDVITVYADTVRQYHQAYEQFVKEGALYEVMTESGSTKKSGLASALEVLRKDIGTLSDRLMLNPKAGIIDQSTAQAPNKMNTEDLLTFLDEKLSS